MPTIVTLAPLRAPTRTSVAGKGRLLVHKCQDGHGRDHKQRLPLGSVRGIVYLDALCLHCGVHYVWTEDESRPPRQPSPGR